MPRKKREESPTGIYHWIVRGMNRRKLFHAGSDYEHFFELLREYKEYYQFLVFHYCMMPNHVHLLIKSPTLKDLSMLFGPGIAWIIYGMTQRELGGIFMTAIYPMRGKRFFP